MKIYRKEKGIPEPEEESSDKEGKKKKDSSDKKKGDKKDNTAPTPKATPAAPRKRTDAGKCADSRTRGR